MPQIDVSPEVLDDLVAANRILADQGILDAFGHVSIRHPNNPEHYLMSPWLAPALVTADDIAEYDLESVALTHAGMQLYSERYIHSEIYKVRPDVHAIVHSHSPTVIPFSVSKVKLKAICHMSAFLKQDVPVFEIRDCDGMTDLLIRNEKHGSALARSLGAANVALMRGHGNVCVGANVMTAVYRAIYTEVNARLQAQAIALGGPIEFLSPEESELITGRKDTNFQRPWAMWKSRITVE